MKFHWFLPTNGGDGRHVVSGGHGVDHGAAGRPASVPYLGQIARSAEQLGFEAALTPTGAWCEDAWLSTAMLAPLTERLTVPRRLPARSHVPDARRADGRDVPEPQRRSPAPQRRHRRRVPRAACLRRLPRQGRALRALRRVPRDRASALGRRGGHLHRSPPPGRERPAPAAARPGPGHLLRRLLARGGRRRGQARRRLPHLGRAARRGREEDRVDPGPRREAGSRAVVRHPPPHDHARHRRGGLGRGRPPPVGHLGRRHPSRAGGAAALGVGRPEEHAGPQRGVA